MKDRIKDIISTFVSFNYPKKINRLFHLWLVQDNRSDEKEKALKELWSDTKASADKSTDEAFVRVLHNVGIEIIPERRLYRFPILRYAAAVALICASVISFSLYLGHTHNATVSMTEHYVKKGETESITLPDGSTAFLNSGSYMYYPSNFEGKVRKVYLVGEGTFRVAKNPDKPFIVHTHDVETMALGTRFNVKAYAEDRDIITTLLQGRVKIDCKNDTVYFLNSGEQVLYNKHTCKSMHTLADTESVTAWQRGDILLQGLTISEIADVMERHFGVEFRLKGRTFHGNDRYFFEFKKDATLEEVLDVMRIVIGNFEYSMKDNICYISFL